MAISLGIYPTFSVFSNCWLLVWVLWLPRPESPLLGLLLIVNRAVVAIGKTGRLYKSEILQGGLWDITSWNYPLVNIQKTMENHHFWWANPCKSTISMAMFNSFLYVYQAGYHFEQPFLNTDQLLDAIMSHDQKFWRPLFPPVDLASQHPKRRGWPEPRQIFTVQNICQGQPGKCHCLWLSCHHWYAESMSKNETLYSANYINNVYIYNIHVLTFIMNYPLCTAIKFFWTQHQIKKRNRVGVR